MDSILRRLNSHPWRLLQVQKVSLENGMLLKNINPKRLSKITPSIADKAVLLQTLLKRWRWSSKNCFKKQSVQRRHLLNSTCFTKEMELYEQDVWNEGMKTWSESQKSSSLTCTKYIYIVQEAGYGTHRVSFSWQRHPFVHSPFAVTFLHRVNMGLCAVKTEKTNHPLTHSLVPVDITSKADHVWYQRDIIFALWQIKLWQ